MTLGQVSCPKCGAATVQGQLVPQKSPSAGAAMAFLTSDAAASVLAAQSGTLIVHAFCLSCGATWVPAEENLIRAARGEHGEAARTRARHELEEMVKRGSGFKMVSDDEKRLAAWAKNVLMGVDRPAKTNEPR